MSSVGVAVLGCGRMGKIHLDSLTRLAGVEVRWVVEDAKFHPQAQQVLKSLSLGSTRLMDVGEVQQVYDDQLVKAVLICTPAFTHESLIKVALNNGKHVFCEKPIGLSVESVRSSYQLARDKKLTLYCGFQRRCDNDFREIHDKIKGGDIGKLRIIKITCRDSPSHNTPEFIKTSGGMFLDACVHDFDVACWMAGEHPESVVAFGHAHEEMYAENKDVDITSIMIKFPSGTIATIDNSRIGSWYGYDQRLEVLGSKGMLRLENPRTSNVQSWNQGGTTLAPMTYQGCQRYSTAYSQEVAKFVDIVSGKETCDIHAEDIVMVHTLIELCQKSVQSGSTLPVPHIKL